MSSARLNPSIAAAAAAAVDPAPLLGGARRGGGGGGGGGVGALPRRPSLRGAARFLRRAGSRRVMREPSMLVREAAAEQLEERQSDWAYSRPVVVLDILWNLAFVAVAAGVLVLSRDEAPSMPLRLWIVGYALQCVLHMVCVLIEYRRRHPARRRGSEGIDEGGSHSGSSGPSSPRDIEEGGGNGGGYDLDQGQNEEGTSIAKHLESANTMFSFIWWIIGFYWVSAGGQALTHDAPQLYWLCIVFLAFDVFFVVFCVALACVIGIAVCCCLPCIIAILYAVADQQEGASDEDIRQLPRYKFRTIGDQEKLGGEQPRTYGGIMTECGSDPPIEHALSAEDAMKTILGGWADPILILPKSRRTQRGSLLATIQIQLYTHATFAPMEFDPIISHLIDLTKECCICLSAYDDGVELRELPCGHHFHSTCIDKWLYINATCPLCKYNIIKSNSLGREEV